jgi:predicted nucleotide-binding protein
MKQAVARFIERLGLEPIFLDEQANKGKTIIEKLTENIDIGYAIILLSPDDKGYSVLQGSKKAKYRIRQNVVFEWGIFNVALGRERVMLLRKEVEGKELELPSDCAGLVYTPYDIYGGWKAKLLKELKAFGYKVDANRFVQ